MLYKNLTAREMFAAMRDTKDVAELFKKGLRCDNDRLAGSAMEELIRRGDTEAIIEVLDDFYKEDGGDPESSTILFILMRDLADSCRKEAGFLSVYASTAPHSYGPTEWFKRKATKHLEKANRSGAIESSKTKAKQYLML